MKSEDNGGRLAAALVENDRLRSENERLRKLLRVREVCPLVVSASEMETLSPVTPPLAADEKIRLFRSLFRGREDIYAVRWEGKNGKAGYSPAHIRRGWFASKTEARANREFLPLTDAVIRDHLSGKLTAGVYPLLKDETCWFLAADFDKTTWQEDTTAFLQTCSRFGVPAYLERSRSGGGAHVWIFFEQPTGDAHKDDGKSAPDWRHFKIRSFTALRPCAYPLLANRGSSTVRRSFPVIWDCRADARVK
jgi:hypothetical protein